MQAVNIICNQNNSETHKFMAMARLGYLSRAIKPASNNRRVWCLLTLPSRNVAYEAVTQHQCSNVTSTLLDATGAISSADQIHIQSSHVRVPGAMR